MPRTRSGLTSNEFSPSANGAQKARAPRAKATKVAATAGTRKQPKAVPGKRSARTRSQSRGPSPLEEASTNTSNLPAAAAAPSMSPVRETTESPEPAPSQALTTFAASPIHPSQSPFARHILKAVSPPPVDAIRTLWPGEKRDLSTFQEPSIVDDGIDDIDGDAEAEVERPAKRSRLENNTIRQSIEVDYTAQEYTHDNSTMQSSFDVSDGATPSEEPTPTEEEAQHSVGTSPDQYNDLATHQGAGSSNTTTPSEGDSDMPVANQDAAPAPIKAPAPAPTSPQKNAHERAQERLKLDMDAPLNLPRPIRLGPIPRLRPQRESLDSLDTSYIIPPSDDEESEDEDDNGEMKPKPKKTPAEVRKEEAAKLDAQKAKNQVLKSNIKTYMRARNTLYADGVDFVLVPKAAKNKSSTKPSKNPEPNSNESTRAETSAPGPSTKTSITPPVTPILGSIVFPAMAGKKELILTDPLQIDRLHAIAEWLLRDPTHKLPEEHDMVAFLDNPQPQVASPPRPDEAVNGDEALTGANQYTDDDEILAEQEQDVVDAYGPEDDIVMPEVESDNQVAVIEPTTPARNSSQKVARRWSVISAVKSIVASPFTFLGNRNRTSTTPAVANEAQADFAYRHERRLPRNPRTPILNAEQPARRRNVPATARRRNVGRPAPRRNIQSERRPQPIAPNPQTVGPAIRINGIEGRIRKMPTKQIVDPTTNQQDAGGSSIKTYIPIHERGIITEERRAELHRQQDEQRRAKREAEEAKAAEEQPSKNVGTYTFPSATDDDDEDVGDENSPLRPYRGRRSSGASIGINLFAASSQKRKRNENEEAQIPEKKIPAAAVAQGITKENFNFQGSFSCDYLDSDEDSESESGSPNGSTTPAGPPPSDSYILQPKAWDQTPPPKPRPSNATLPLPPVTPSAAEIAKANATRYQPKTPSGLRNMLVMSSPAESLHGHPSQASFHEEEIPRWSPMDICVATQPCTPVNMVAQMPITPLPQYPFTQFNSDYTFSDKVLSDLEKLAARGHTFGL